MLIRRCFALLMEPAELLEFDAGRLVQDGAPWRVRPAWRALAGHLDEAVEIDESQLLALGRLPIHAWQPIPDDPAQAEVLSTLIRIGLVIAEHGESAHRAADDTLRQVGWHAISAVFHRHTRWHDADSRAAADALATLGSERRTALQGTPPEPVLRRQASAAPLRLPAPPADALDELLGRRVTCRNFDRQRAVSSQALSACLYRAFGAQATARAGTPHLLLKKFAPSAGGLHPIDVFVFVRQVESLHPGTYHYLPDTHALEPIELAPDQDIETLCKLALAGQDWFVGAPVLLALACRFDRSYWKYREHAKTYRAASLDLGHASQLLYLAATEQGLGCFVTSAINERPLDEALGLDPCREGVLAMSGLGYRAAERREVEFDPLARVWPGDSL
ncbi:putative peptide maturation dehydrogenase [Pseudomarimonas salicorniae]|uniref:Peptide maturation dehydrogenase n=1 Tax=Pseudomarimonas salicorniae TaxID=2933270 RepID=A0ABT0GF74_9GAMM|nr:putative peptide maturation dehydrogenase [Lysobacter sp. CAU 1642]MCK7593199.1 putative peptide maturation dehydrogenase [Lysobacter sp. CAU 1642]